mmetsp:Transcript_15786/g.43007  ORF Transcript_15786/g.43007 Transcript_15786/m.43007 type:complete len:387 (+) Transcript_15786:132-1292(+)
MSRLRHHILLLHGGPYLVSFFLLSCATFVFLRRSAHSASEHLLKSMGIGFRNETIVLANHSNRLFDQCSRDAGKFAKTFEGLLRESNQSRRSLSGGARLEELSCTQPDRGLPVNFLATGAGLHSDFLPLYAFFALASNSDAFVEMVVENSHSFVKRSAKSLRWLTLYFGEDRICVRGFRNSIIARTDVQNTWRYLETPLVKANYTYIGDVDIFLTEDVVHPKRIAQMNYFSLPYSNIVRQGTVKLTGLMLVNTSAFYTEKLSEAQETQDAKGNDEEFLYRIVKNSGIGLPHPWNDSDELTTHRPLHGYHISLNRVLGKQMCQTTWVEETNQFCKAFTTTGLIDLLSTDEGGKKLLLSYLGVASAQIHSKATLECPEGKVCVCSATT